MGPRRGEPEAEALLRLAGSSTPATAGPRAARKTWARAHEGAPRRVQLPGHTHPRHAPHLSRAAVEPHRAHAQAGRGPRCASYNGSLHTLYFVNGSLIHFGHWAGEQSELEYNGQGVRLDLPRRGDAVHLAGLPVPRRAAARRQRLPQALLRHLQPGPASGHRWGEAALHRPGLHHGPGKPRGEREPGRLSASSPRRWRTTRRS